MSTKSKSARAFTLVELMVAMAILAILAALVLAAVSRAKGAGQMASCLNNFKQLQLCWQLYADDYRGWLVTNEVRNPDSWVTGSMETHRGATNPADITNGALFYYNKTLSLYKCPSASGVSQYGVNAAEMVRTVSATPRWGNWNDHDGLIDSIDEADNGISNNILKMSEFVAPTPGNATIFGDESVVTIDDSFFAIDNPTGDGPYPNGYRNSPTMRHNGSGTFSYADGHVGEISFNPGCYQEFTNGFPHVVNAEQRPAWRAFVLTIYAPSDVPP